MYSIVCMYSNGFATDDRRIGPRFTRNGNVQLVAASFWPFCGEILENRFIKTSSDRFLWHVVTKSKNVFLRWKIDLLSRLRRVGEGVGGAERLLLLVSKSFGQCINKKLNLSRLQSRSKKLAKDRAPPVLDPILRSWVMFNAGAAKIYNATSSLVRFENIFSYYLEKCYM
jgi:hypothetical protein